MTNTQGAAVKAVKNQSKKKKVHSQCSWCYRENNHKTDVCRFGPGGSQYDPVKFPQKEKPAGWVDRPELQVTKKKADKVKANLGDRFEAAAAEQSDNEATSEDEQASGVQRHANKVTLKKSANRVTVKKTAKKAKVYSVTKRPPNAQSKFYYMSDEQRRGKTKRQCVFADSGSDLNLAGKKKANRDQVTIHPVEEKLEV